MDSGTTDRLFFRLLEALERWYADPARAIDYENRPPVRQGKHGESKMALPQGRPPINWRREWREASTQAQREEILWAILYELDPRAPVVQQGKNFYGDVTYRVDPSGTAGRPLTAPIQGSGVLPRRHQSTDTGEDPTQ